MLNQLETLLKNDSFFVDKIKELIRTLVPREVFTKFIKDEYSPFLISNDAELCSEALINLLYSFFDIGEFILNYNERAELLINQFIDYISKQYQISLDFIEGINILFGWNKIGSFVRQYCVELYKEYDKQDGFFSKYKGKEYDPYKFYLLKDKIGDLQYSSRSPYTFSQDRTSPIIVINDHIELKENDDDHHLELINHYKEKHKNNDAIWFNTLTDEDSMELPDNITEVAAGSVFNKVVLLENAEGNIEKIKSVLLNKGYKKIYINNNNPETSKEYKRIASLRKYLFHKL